MKKLILFAFLGLLSFGAKAQLSYQIDTAKYNHGILLGAPGGQVDSGYYQPVTFNVQIVNCPYPEFEVSSGCTVFIPNAYINANTPVYVFEQVVQWINNKYK